MKNTKVQRGITLIALIITIIILLILAVVTIGSMKDSNIITYAQNAASGYNDEKSKEENAIAEYETLIDESIAGKDQKVTSKVTGPIGEAINTENYGKKVIGFKSKGEGLDTLVWRVFYQDANNYYLISETADGDYPVSQFSFYNFNGDDMPSTKKEIVEKYNSGLDVSKQGQDLMPLASSLFVEKNTNKNIIATAYMCDIDVWEEYTDEEGNAVWAMGGPTIELFANSYNSLKLKNTINISVKEAGYTDDTKENWFKSNVGKGIYRLNTNSTAGWYLASPLVSAGRLANVDDYFGYFSYCTIGLGRADESCARPIVCIPTSNFDYELS